MFMTLFGATSFVTTLFGIALLLTSIFLILLVLVQRGRGGGLTGALGGAGGQSAFGSKAGDVFTKITVWTTVFWIVLCVFAVKMLGTADDKLDAGLGSDVLPLVSGSMSTPPETGDTLPVDTAPVGAAPTDTAPTDGGAAPAETNSAPTGESAPAAPATSDEN